MQIRSKEKINKRGNIDVATTATKEKERENKKNRAAKR